MWTLWTAVTLQTTTYTQSSWNWYPRCSRSSTGPSGSGPPRSCGRSRCRSGSWSGTSRGSTASSPCPPRWSWGWRRRKPPLWSAASSHPGYTASCRPGRLLLLLPLLLLLFLFLLLLLHTEESSSGQRGSDPVRNFPPLEFYLWREHLLQPALDSCGWTAEQAPGRLIVPETARTGSDPLSCDGGMKNKSPERSGRGGDHIIKKS